MLEISPPAKPPLSLIGSSTAFSWLLLASVPQMVSTSIPITTKTPRGRRGLRTGVHKRQDSVTWLSYCNSTLQPNKCKRLLEGTYWYHSEALRAPCRSKGRERKVTDGTWSTKPEILQLDYYTVSQHCGQRNASGFATVHNGNIFKRPGNLAVAHAVNAENGEFTDLGATAFMSFTLLTSKRSCRSHFFFKSWIYGKGPVS